ncbi:MAG: ABC transporter ATP-binding protein [Phycisphaerales bacterium]|nr:ABC transporter ATP-binding protein [Phycisphaerales bacterium]
MIEIKGITKKFGSLVAVDDLSLEIGEGDLFGFIGPNGAGKSTTMKVLACLIRPDSGSAKVCGFSTKSEGEQIRRVIGYMPDFLGVYDDLTVDEYLQFFAAAFSVPRSRRRSVIDAVLELTNLTEKKRAMVSSLSRGMQQRLGVARVLIHEPKVLLLDEPASGLDPRARIEMRELLVRLRDMGKCLMVSSHILTELGEMSTSIGIIEKGKLVYAGTLADALERTRGGERILISLEHEPATEPTPEPAAIIESDAAADGTAESDAEDSAVAQPAKQAAEMHPDTARAAGLLREDPRVVSVVADNGSLLVELVPEERSHHFVLEKLINAGVRIQAFEPKGARLEDAFLKLTKGALQ